MSSEPSRHFDPYQVLFPLGFTHAVFGALTWVLFAFKVVPYPGPLHAHHMLDGFLLSFSAGFMLTAIPRFTGAATCSKRELAVATSISLVSFFESGAVMALAMLIFLAIFFARRIRVRTFSPPPHFIFLPIGLLLGITGSTMLSLAQTRLLDSSFAAPGRLFLYYGTMLSFLLGIGAKLIAALLGWSAPPTHREAHEARPAAGQPVNRKKWVVPLIQGAVFLAGFVLEALHFVSLGRTLRALCATWIGLQNWKLYRLPRQKGKLSFWIWISAWTLVLGLWTHALFPTLDIHAAHLIFIGGFGSMSFLIASRVTLAHGGFSLDMESRSRIFAVMSTIILAAAATRVSAPWTPSFFQHLAYAAGLWVVALLAWGRYFLPKIIFTSKT